MWVGILLGIFFVVGVTLVILLVTLNGFCLKEHETYENEWMMHSCLSIDIWEYKNRQVTARGMHTLTCYCNQAKSRKFTKKHKYFCICIHMWYVYKVEMDEYEYLKFRRIYALVLNMNLNWRWVSLVCVLMWLKVGRESTHIPPFPWPSHRHHHPYW